MKLRIGTRGSALALTQARFTARELARHGHETELVILKTQGDADQKNPFAEVGSAGLFVREIERALVDSEVDVAVHSYKDLPSDSPAELVVAAVPGREDPRDRLILRPAALDEDGEHMPVRWGARVGTAAARRSALLRHLRPDIEIALLRGNVPTRVRKLHEIEYDAIILAAAGLDRLDRAAAAGEGESPSREGLIERPLDPEVFVPAPSQGAIALQVRGDDGGARAAVTALDDEPIHRAVHAERELLAKIQAGCEVPFGAHCTPGEAGGLVLNALLEVGSDLRRARVEGAEPEALARAAYAALLPERGDA